MLFSLSLLTIKVDIGEVTISMSGSNTAGENSSLVCSAIIETQSDTPPPYFQWFSGPRNVSLPFFLSPVTASSGNTHTSTLQFSPTDQSYAGNYTCRLGGNAMLAARTEFIVNRTSNCSTFIILSVYIAYDVFSSSNHLRQCYC